MEPDECWVLSLLFLSPLSPSSRCSLVPLCSLLINMLRTIMRFPHFITMGTEAHNNQNNLGLILFLVTQDSFRPADFLFYFIYFWLCWVLVTAWIFQSCSQPSLLLCHCGAWGSHCGDSSCGAQALGQQALVVVVRALSSCRSQALEHRLSSCGAQA